MKYMTRLAITGSLRLVVIVLLNVALAGLMYVVMVFLIAHFPSHALR